MEEIYRLIEEKIKASGYLGYASGEEIYDEICDEIEEKVGKWNDFELDGNGCERGVYAGKFFYDNIRINSRTYDKGETFHIVSVNEE